MNNIICTIYEENNDLNYLTSIIPLNKFFYINVYIVGCIKKYKDLYYIC